MSANIHTHRPKASYFFTVRLHHRGSALLTERIDLLRDCFKLCHKRWPMRIDAAVILPDHLHMIWTMPDGDDDYSKRWRLIKSSFSRHVPAPDYVPASTAKRGEKGIWQRRFWEHRIKDLADFERHRTLISEAPVQAGLVKMARDWPYSSLSRGRKGPARVGTKERPLSKPLPRLHQPEIEQLL